MKGGQIMDAVVVDVEIQRTVEELPKKWDSSELMGVGVAVVYEYQTDRFRIFGPQDVEALRVRLLKADRISGFNIARFDFPVIWACKNRTLTPDLAQILEPKTDDLLLRIYSAMGLSLTNFTSAHKGWKADTVARGTLGGVGKIADGAQAPIWFQQGEFGKLYSYCLDDVSLERDLTTFVDKYGYVVNGDTGRCVKIPRWEPAPPPPVKAAAEFDL